MAANHRLLGRRVKFAEGQYIANDEWGKFFTQEGGTIEAVYYDKDSHYGNGYRVLVRNESGKTLEIPLSMLELSPTTEG